MHRPNGMGRLAFALALVAGALGSSNVSNGQAELASLTNHYRGQPLNGGRSTNAATLKRAAKKRRNIRARSAK